MSAAPSSRFVRKLLHGEPPGAARTRSTISSAPNHACETIGDSNDARAPLRVREATDTPTLGHRSPSTDRRSEVDALLSPDAPSIQSRAVETLAPITFEVGYDEPLADERDPAEATENRGGPLERPDPTTSVSPPQTIVGDRRVVASPNPSGVEAAETVRIGTDRIQALKRRRLALEARIGGSRLSENRFALPSHEEAGKPVPPVGKRESERPSNLAGSQRPKRACATVAPTRMRPTVRIDRDPDEDSAYDAVLLRIRSALAARGSVEAPATGSAAWPFASLAVGICTEGIDATSVAVGLALRLAHQSDRRVCIVDASTSGRSLTDRAGLCRHAGLNDLLEGSLKDDDPFIPVENANVSILPAGRVIDSARATTANYDTAVELLESRFDHVLYDVGSFHEQSALRWSRRIANAVLVLGVGRSLREEISRTVTSLQVTGVRLLGAVLQRQEKDCQPGETRYGSVRFRTAES